MPHKNPMRPEPGLTLVTGAQVGDEGKGKIIHYLTQFFNTVFRYQGGANAGHTIFIDGKPQVLHLIPSGIFYPNVACALGAGMVIDPIALVEEMLALEKLGIKFNPARFWISHEAHVLIEPHKILDRVIESYMSDGKVGTTGRGIGPAYAGKALRVNIRFMDLLDPSTLFQKIQKEVGLLMGFAKSIDSKVGCDDTAVYQLINNAAETLKPFITDVSHNIITQLKTGDCKVLGEGAQGAMLDTDHGTYPFCTSSAISPAAAFHYMGIPLSYLRAQFGVAKAYTTKVGNGPFPTIQVNAIGDFLRERGGEKGATTCRPRDCGWLDLPLLRAINNQIGFDGLIITKLDVLSGIPILKVCNEYADLSGQLYDVPKFGAAALEHLQPRYDEHDTWGEDISGHETFNQLPSEAISYVMSITKETGIPLVGISVGPKAEQYIPMIK